MPETEAEVQAAVAGLAAEGFSAVKLGWGPLGQDVDNDVRLARAAVEGGAGRLEVMIDAGLGYRADVARATRAARAFEELGVKWLEEPFEPDAIHEYAALADGVSIPIAAGEHETTRWGFRELIESAHLDIVQPDVTRCGGLRETVRIAEAAAAAGRRCVTHGWKTGIVKAASLNVNAVIPGSEYLEYCVASTPLNETLTVESFPLEDGFVSVPTAPGLGVTLDVEVLRRYAVGEIRMSELL
jgi:L-alanine-DL-glutamate epimerase-like enolase superfamily enzyme